MEIQFENELLHAIHTNTLKQFVDANPESSLAALLHLCRVHAPSAGHIIVNNTDTSLWELAYTLSARVGPGHAAATALAAAQAHAHALLDAGAGASPVFVNGVSVFLTLATACAEPFARLDGGVMGAGDVAELLSLSVRWTGESAPEVLARLAQVVCEI